MQYFHFFQLEILFYTFIMFLYLFFSPHQGLNWNHKNFFQWTVIKVTTYIRRMYNHFFLLKKDTTCTYSICYILGLFLVKNSISVANVCSDKIFLIRLTQFMSLLSYIIDRHQSFEEDLWLFIPTLKSLNTSSEMQSLNIYW